MADYGVLKPIVEASGAIVNVGLALQGLVFGKVGFDPPIPKPKPPVRILSALSGTIAALLWKFGRGQFDTLTFEKITAIAVALSLVFLVSYLVAYFGLPFTCPDDPKTQYLKGLWLRPKARAVLRGDRNQPQPYGPLSSTPSDVQTYFCNSGRKTAFLWEPWSITAAPVLLVILFGFLLFSSSTAITSAAMVLLGPDVKVETKSGLTHVELPARVLFGFNKAELLPGADPVLERAATVLRSRAVKSATIKGYTDSVGSPDYNQVLSERRAAAVYAWLKDHGDLGSIDLHVLGLGQAEPRAPNRKPDNSDDPEGRALNRRVEIIFAS